MLMKPFELISLPYAPEDLEPVISRETIALHHGKHLQTYVTNLNNLLPGSGMEELALEELDTPSVSGPGKLVRLSVGSDLTDSYNSAHRQCAEL